MQSVVETIIDASNMIQTQRAQIEADNDDFDNIYDAIVDKGQTPTYLDRDTYPTAIRNITTTPRLQDKSVTPTTSQQVINADSGYDGLDDVTVAGVTSAIDQNIVAGNIKKDVEILGVIGSFEGGGVPSLQDKSVTPTTSQQVITCDQGYEGLDEVTVDAVTSSIDANIIAGNIKKNVQILGVTGSYEGSGGGGSNYNIEQTSKASLTDAVELRTLFEYDGALHAVTNGKHFTYDASNDSWTLVNTDADLLAGDSITEKRNYGVCIGDFLYWLNNSGGNTYVSKYDLVNGTISLKYYQIGDKYFDCFCADNEYIYALANQYGTNTLFKINPVNETYQELSISNLTQLMTLKCGLDGIYGLIGGALYKIDLTQLSCTKLGEVVAEARFINPGLIITTDYIFVIGGNYMTQKVYAYDGSSYAEYATLTSDSNNGDFIVYNGDLYELGVEGESWTTFRISGTDFIINKYIHCVNGLVISTNGIGNVICEVDQAPTLQSKSVNPSTSQQVVTPDQGYGGLTSVTVAPVTSSIDNDIQASNILKGKNILGVNGNIDIKNPCDGWANSDVDNIVDAPGGVIYFLYTPNSTQDVNNNIFQMEWMLGGIYSTIGGGVADISDANIEYIKYKPDYIHTETIQKGNYDRSNNSDPTISGPHYVYSAITADRRTAGGASNNQILRIWINNISSAEEVEIKLKNIAFTDSNITGNDIQPQLLLRLRD